MTAKWPKLAYEDWAASCMTLHAHTQLLGKLAVAMAPAEPQLQHVALRLTARGWETPPLPTPDGAGTLVAALDLRQHQVVVEHSAIPGARVVPLGPDRPVAEVTRGVLREVGALGGAVDFDLTPQEVPWSTPLDMDTEHATYDERAVSQYFSAVTQAAIVLTRLRAPFRGRSTPVNAWWGSFDLSVTFFSGRDADPPADDYIARNAMDAQELSVGWWPGDHNYGRAAFYAYAYPAPDGFADGAVPAPARWDTDLSEYVLDWEDARALEDSAGEVIAFARAVFDRACACDTGWRDPLVGLLGREPLS